MNLTIIDAKRFPARRMVAWLQAALVLVVPFVRISGESAVRFDIPSLKLYFFGSVFWISESTFFLLVFLFFLAGIRLFMKLYGRVWCRWVCPQSVFSVFTQSLERAASWLTEHRTLRKLLSHTLLLLFSGVVSACLVWYFVSPYAVIDSVLKRSLGPWTFWSWVFFCALSYGNLVFVRAAFCGSRCSYAETGLRVKTGRPRVKGLAVTFALTAMVFAYQMYIRVPVDFHVIRDGARRYHQTGFNGGMMNAYSLTIANYSLHPQSCRLSISGIKDAELVIPRNPFLLPPNSAVKVRVYIRAERKNLTYRVTSLHFTLKNTAFDEIQVVREAPFVYPDRTERGVEI